MKDGGPIILIEAKSASNALPVEATPQLRRYFQGHSK